jgi:cytochrome c-type biogenesis protein CcsB
MKKTIKKIFSLLFSPKTALILLLLFTASIAVATFVEDRHDTITAQLLIYKAWWFELIIGLLALNFIGNIRRYHLLSKGKIGGLLFHSGFILLIIGAAVTRYFGFEGTMHIREGESSRTIYSTEPYLQVNVSGTRGSFSNEHQLYLSSSKRNNFSYKIKSDYDHPVIASFNRYIKNAEEFVNENIPGGEDMIALQISSGGTNQGVYLKKGERINAGGVFIAFADTLNDNDILITPEEGKLVARSKMELYGMDMTGEKPDTTQKGTLIDFREKNLFQYKDVMFTLIKFYRQAELDFKKAIDDGHDHEQGMDVLIVNIEYNGQKKKVNLIGVDNPAQRVTFGDIKIDVRYGAKEIKLPFEVKLNDFILDRYAGSMSPSSFASEVMVIDSQKNSSFGKRIYMNHVLDYKGYRFFQSSYDTDERGTILSVNHDFLGTWISYVSYFILLIGFTITMFSKSSRYHFLSVAIRKLREKRKSVMLLAAVLFCGNIAQSQHKDNHKIDPAEVEKFGHIIVQTHDGRLEPLHTLAYDVMHKIAKKDKFRFEDRPPMDAMMVLIDMLADPEYWKQQKIIYIREKSVSNILGIDGRYASFNDFLDKGSQYKLAELVEKAFQKSQSQQNRFDKELIKVDERVNLYYMLLQGSLLKIFPVDNASAKWVDWNDSLAKRPLTGTMGLINNDLQLKDFNYSSILWAYLQELMAGFHSGNFDKADRILGYIKNIQQNSVLAKKFPSEAKISAEIHYNKLKIFNKLKGYYGLLSLLLLIFGFTYNLKSKNFKWLRLAHNICIVLLLIVFLYHTYGMGLRWYLAGHAPWSNGYEVLLLVAWSAVMAGFFFIKNSKIIQAATAFLASMILMTAGHSNYDPQLTNLQPVLQSYWLIIHVAVITISYGFLALGFILGTINMFLYLSKSQKNGAKTDLLISELTFVNEKNLQIGLFLATLGTFLGGVWASESWGRYWGWDAKETWALIIIVVYSIILHLRLVPKLKGSYVFNVSSIIGFGSVLMTFIGVNYFFSKGLHSYASDEKTIFPLWGWLMILSFIILMVAAGVKEKMENKNNGGNSHSLP